MVVVAGEFAMLKWSFVVIPWVAGLMCVFWCSPFSLCIFLLLISSVVTGFGPSVSFDVWIAVLFASQVVSVSCSESRASSTALLGTSLRSMTSRRDKELRFAKCFSTTSFFIFQIFSPALGIPSGLVLISTS